MLTKCPFCQTQFNVEAPNSGQLVHCPTCHKDFPMSSQAEAPASISQPAAAAPSPTSPNASQAFLPPNAPNPASSCTSMGAAVIALCVAVITLLLAALFWFRYPSPSHMGPIIAKSPEAVVKAKLDRFGNYYPHYAALSSQSAIVGSLSIDEVKEKGNLAVVFYSYKIGKCELQEVSYCLRSADQKWLEISKYYLLDAFRSSKSGSLQKYQRWLDNLEEKVKKWEKGSEKDDLWEKLLSDDGD